MLTYLCRRFGRKTCDYADDYDDEKKVEDNNKWNGTKKNMKK